MYDDSEGDDCKSGDCSSEHSNDKNNEKDTDNENVYMIGFATHAKGWFV